MMYLKCTYADFCIYHIDLRYISMEKDKHLGLRIDSETHDKLKKLSEYDGRSINGEVLYLIRQAIKDYEKKNGKL